MYPRSTSEEFVALGRGDLISFALLTGSDLVGDGLPKVGHKKAIRFIRQCQLDYPLSPTTATIDELKSWARTASVLDGRDSTENKIQERCCSVCCHPGDKRSHEKNGCETCGTKPGEPCFALSTGDRFRKALRTKALAMEPKFDPAFVIAGYMNPNDNQVPITLVGETARSLCMNPPSLRGMMEFPYIVKGQSLAASRDYVKQSLARLMARTELFNHAKPTSSKGQQKPRLSRERPIPIEITRKLVHNKLPCYDIAWSVNATVTDSEGNGVDGYEFSTIEEQSLVEKRHPDLVKAFLEREKQDQKQGDAEASRRRNFVETLLDDGGLPAKRLAGAATKPGKKGRRASRSGFFEKKRAEGICNLPRQVEHRGMSGGDDVQKLMALVCKQTAPRADEYDGSSIESVESDLDKTENVAHPGKHSGDCLKEVEVVFRQQNVCIHEARKRDQTGWDENTKDQPHAFQEPQTKSLLHAPSMKSPPNKRYPQVAAHLEKHAPSSDKDSVNCPRGKRGRVQETPDACCRIYRSLKKRSRKTIDLQIVCEEKAFSEDALSRESLDRMEVGRFPEEHIPVLTPGCYHSVVCDMGIRVEITPLISSRF